MGAPGAPDGGGGEEVKMRLAEMGRSEVRLSPEEIAESWGNLRIKRKIMVWGRK